MRQQQDGNSFVERLRNVRIGRTEHDDAVLHCVNKVVSGGPDGSDSILSLLKRDVGEMIASVVSMRGDECLHLQIISRGSLGAVGPSSRMGESITVEQRINLLLGERALQ